MEARQSISKTRREYSKWVKDQTRGFRSSLHGKKGTKPQYRSRRQNSLGGDGISALEALSAAATLQYGFINTLFAMFAVAAAIVLTGCPLPTTQREAA